MEENELIQYIEHLQEQNSIDFQEIKKLKKQLNELLNKVTLQNKINDNIIYKIKNEYETMKETILDENKLVELDLKVKDLDNDVDNISDSVNTSINNITSEINSLKENSTKFYSTLEELGLTESATIDNVVRKLKNGESAYIRISQFSDRTQFADCKYAILTVIKSSDLCELRLFDVTASDKIYYGVMNNNKFSKWVKISTGAYTSLSELNLDSTATITNVIKKLKNGESAYIRTSKFDDQTQFADVKYGILSLIKTSDLTELRLYDVTTKNKLYYGLTENGLFSKWVKVSTNPIITSLNDLGLTAPVTVGEIFNAMGNNTMLILACEDKANHITDVPMDYGILTIKKITNARFSIDCQNSLNSSPCNVKRWIGTLKGVDGTGLYWRMLSTQVTYTSLSDMELTASATIQDVIDKLQVGDTALLRTDSFTEWNTLFNSIQYGYFKVEKTINGLSNIVLQDVVVPDRKFFGAQSNGKFSRWVQYPTLEQVRALLQS